MLDDFFGFLFSPNLNPNAYGSGSWEQAMQESNGKGNANAAPSLDLIVARPHWWT